MKTVNKIMIIICCFLFIISCTNKNLKSIKNKNISIIDFQKDSVFYKIDVMNDGENELFLMTNNFVISNDSIIGGIENYDNHRKASEIINTNKNYENSEIKIVSKVFFYENNSFKQIAKISSRTDEFTYPILKQGNFFEHIIIDDKKFGGGFLRIQEVSDYYIGGRYINMIYFKNKWRIYSKEIDNPTKALVQYPRGYCVDSTAVNYDLNKSDFNEIFFLGNGFKCHNYLEH